MAPNSSSDGALSPGFDRLRNAVHCRLFCGSFREPSVRAGTAVPRTALVENRLLSERNMTLIQKPFDPEELAQKIRESLSRNSSPS
jgi:hypothetical protein